MIVYFLRYLRFFNLYFINKVFIITMIFMSINNIVLSQDVELKILDSITKTPIENVYLYDDEKAFLTVSDQKGICVISMQRGKDFVKQKTINISHIGYMDKTINIFAPNLKANQTILLNPKVFDIKEVVVSPIDANYIVKKAIENISNNYLSIINDTVAVKLNFIFLDKPDKILANFEGNIALTSNEKHLLAAKFNVKNEDIDKNFYDYNAETSPIGFYSMIFITSHAPIRKYKKTKFNYDATIKTEYGDAYKISFVRTNKYNNIKGYMLINIDDYAITHINYKIGKTKNWIASTKKSKGLIFSNLQYYKLSVSYSKNIDKYRFSKGQINVLFNRTNKKKLLSTNTYDIEVSSICDEVPNHLIYSKAHELFKEK